MIDGSSGVCQVSEPVRASAVLALAARQDCCVNAGKVYYPVVEHCLLLDCEKSMLPVSGPASREETR